jgi:hypothetical protein
MCVIACTQYAPVGQTWRDPESLEDVPLVPGMTPMENQLRWGFVQKVSPKCTSRQPCHDEESTDVNAQQTHSAATA